MANQEIGSEERLYYDLFLSNGASISRSHQVRRRTYGAARRRSAMQYIWNASGVKARHRTTLYGAGSSVKEPKNLP